MGGGRERDCVQGRASKGRERVEESERGRRGWRARDAEGAEGGAQERARKGARERVERGARVGERVGSYVVFVVTCKRLPAQH